MIGKLFTEITNCALDSIYECVFFFYSYGYSKERFVWSLISAVGIFCLGSGATVVNGVQNLWIAQVFNQIGYLKSKYLTSFILCFCQFAYFILLRIFSYSSYWLLRLSFSAPWEYEICSFGDMWFIRHWRYCCLHFNLNAVYFCPFLLQWAFSVRCFSYCCHTSCQERCSCGGNEIKRLYLARPWSYICCCDDGGGNLLPLSLVPKHVTVYLV